jgi:hypothetical protein
MEAERKWKAEEEEKAKAGKGMKLAMPVDVSDLEKAQLIDAENVRKRAEGYKLRVGSSKVSLMKPPVNLAWQV